MVWRHFDVIGNAEKPMLESGLDVEMPRATLYFEGPIETQRHNAK